jgi:predicted DNA-binding ribbon-helix-helix protein
MPALLKRSLVLDGHATSLALEAEFWAALEEVSQARGISLAGLLAEIDHARTEGSLASACRLFALAAARRAR